MIFIHIVYSTSALTLIILVIRKISQSSDFCSKEMPCWLKVFSVTVGLKSITVR